MSNTSRFARASVAVLLASTATVLLGGCSWFSKGPKGDYALAAGEEPGERLAAWYQETRTRIPGASITVGVEEGEAPDPNEVVIGIAWQRKDDAPRNRHEVRAFLSGAL